ncbi:Phage-related baseplate assembly protein [Rosistilla carotiformis]|uniref:Phage-related baseplate assembly protein n=1 Tax=Rosistilla carotiformis TaxID=2528017 RepID=A0A518JWN7_9BACT|nr:type VI secretion system tip protein TssI/VgrG [Rosistilla carotiformis]QDV69961.1 Phage-related baseplate assembly protein [Rosistilla carotiformis]
MSVDSLIDPVQTRIHLHSSLGVDRFRLTEIRGRERISGLYRFRLKLRSNRHDPVTLDQFTGLAVMASFQLPNPEWLSVVAADHAPATRDFCGILSHVSYDHSDDRDRYFTAILRPRLWQLGLNRRFRMFSQKTTREIVTTVLGSMNVDWRLANETKPHNYCVQYGESDFAFVSRLLEADGLFYFFEHQYEGQAVDPQDRTERLVITDSIDAANSPPPSSSGASASETSSDSSAATIPTYRFDDVGGGVRDSMRVRRWIATRQLVPETSRSLDRHFQRPKSLADSSHTTICGSTANAATTWMCYPSEVADRVDDITPAGADRKQLVDLDSLAESDAKVRAARLQYQVARFRGEGDVAVMSPGNKFQLVRDRIPDPTAYYLTQVEHLVRLATGQHSGHRDVKLTYKNRFRCSSVTVPYRPARKTAKPRIDGVVPATVVGDASQKDDHVCVDKYGRVKVVFPWQTGTTDTSCWVRVGQFWAGPRWGAFFWPRVDHEVIVAFEHGDPDRPIIVGSVYNATNMPPLTLPSLKLSCGIHSCSHKGNPVNNTSTVVFHDKEGAEYLELHSETYHSISSETTEVKWSAGKEIQFKGHHWLFDAIGGSGGGGNNMSGDDGGTDAQFKEPGEEAESGFSVTEMLKSLFLADDKGEIDFTVGDSFSKTFGGSYASKYGCNISMVCDPMDFFEFLADKIGESAPTAGMLLNPLLPLLFGAGGQGLTTFGGKSNLHYGKAIECHRGYKITKVLPVPKEPATRFSKGNETPVDAPATTACEIAVALLLIIDLAVMLLTKAAVSHKGEHWQGFVKFAEVWTFNILPRLQGLLVFMESTVAKVDDATASVEDTVDDSEVAVQRSARVLETTDSAAPDSTQAATVEVENALSSAATSERKLEQIVEDDEDDDGDEGGAGGAVAGGAEAGGAEAGGAEAGGAEAGGAASAAPSEAPAAT